MLPVIMISIALVLLILLLVSSPLASLVICCLLLMLFLWLLVLPEVKLVRWSNLNLIADPDSFVSESGSDVHVILSPVFDKKTGVISLHESGRVNTHDMIQSYKDMTDMSYILARLHAGDDSVLNRNTCYFGDFTACSYNPAAMLNILQDARSAFDRLSSDIKSEFKDFNDWWSSAGNESWSRKMSGVKVSSSSSTLESVSAPDPVPAESSATDGSAIFV